MSQLTKLKEISGENNVQTHEIARLSEMFKLYPDILTIEELQEALGIGRSTAYHLINSDAIKHWRIGKSIKVPKLYLLDYIADSCYSNSVENRRQKEVIV